MELLYVHSPNYENLTFCTEGSRTCDGDRITVGIADTYVRNSLFDSCRPSTGTGGAINAATNVMVFVESCTFINCHSPDDGGGIDHTAGQIVVAKTCSISCTAYDGGQFLCSNPTNVDHSYRNELHECSVINSNKLVAKYTSIYLYVGTIVVNAVNISNNKCQQWSALCSYPNPNGKLATSTIKYSHIEGNEATTHTCLYMHYASGTPKHLITHTNHHFRLSFL